MKHEEKTPVCIACKALFIPFPDAFMSTPSAIDSVYAPYRFEGLIRNLLHAFKYQEAIYLSQFIAQEIINIAPKTLHQNTCFVPVPLHRKRLKHRGFNQAALLAKMLSTHYKIPYQPRLVTKIKSTPSQSELPLKERAKNLSNAFTVKPHTYEHIVLVDDLITTGFTANTLAKALKKAGANNVSLWCVAKTCLS